MSRRYKGSKRYVEVYNRATREFFQDASTINSGSELESSYITKHYTMVYTKNKSQKGHSGSQNASCGEEGILWSSGEKDLFFRLLGRYGMARLDDIVDGMGGRKGRLEVIQYYTVLKRELEYLKRRRRRIRAMRRLKTLLSEKEFPIAYEMSESFVAMEEAQAHLIVSYEASKINDETRRLKMLLPEIGGADFLINDESCVQLSQLYRKNIQFPGERAPKLTVKTMLFLAELARAYTSEIVLAVITNKVEEACQRGMFFNDDNIGEIPIFRQDIYSAIRLLSDKKRYTLEGYFERLQRLFAVDDSLNSKSDFSWNTPMPMSSIEPFTYSSSEQWAEYNSRIQQESKSEVVHISQIRPKDETPEPENGTELLSVSDGGAAEARKLEQDMAETAKLERSDKLQSRIHEHALLTYLAGEWGSQMLDAVEEEMKQSDADADANANANADTDSNTDSNTDADTDTHTHIDSHTDTDTDADTDTESDAETEIETDVNGNGMPIENGVEAEDQATGENKLDKEPSTTTTAEIDPNLLDIGLHQKTTSYPKQRLSTYVLQFLSSLDSEPDQGLY